MSLDAQRSPVRSRHPVRHRLTDRLLEALGRGRGAALLAGPGYGKTVLIEALLAEIDMHAIWIDLGRFAGDPLPFAREVLQKSAARSGARASRSLAAVPEGLPAGAGAAAAIDLMTAGHAARSDADVLLVLDEFEQVDPQGELAMCLDHLLRGLPAPWKLVVAGRHEPWSGELARQIQYGEIEAFDEESLALTLPEVDAVLAHLDPAGTAARDAGRILALTLGWATGVAHLARSGTAGASGGAPDRMLAGYFRKSVLAGVPDRLRAFMIETSILPFLEVELCDRLRGAADSARILAGLAERHLVARSPSDAGSRFGYHPLLRSFLGGELEAELSTPAVRRLRQRAAAQLARSGALEDAFDQLTAAADWHGVASLLRLHADALFHSGQAAAILRWLDGLPPDTLAGMPWLLVHRARALRQCGVADEPLTSLKRAQHLFALDGNPDGQASALVEEAKQLEAADELAAARKLCARALGLARDPLIKAEILARITLDSALLGYLPEAAEAAHEALELMPSRRDARAVATDQVFVIARLGLAEALSGDFRGGRRHLEQACRLAGRDKVGVVSAMLAHYLHGVVCARAGAHELALGEFDRAQAIADQVGRDDYVRLCHGARGEMLANLGRLRSAESELRDAGWLCNRWVDAAYFYFRTGQHQQAAEIYESDIARAAAREDPLERARAQALLGVCLLAMGPSTLGRRLLEQAARSHAIRGFNSRTPGIRLHLADVAFAEGDPDLGAGLLRQALAGARAGGARHFFAFEPDVTRRCLTRARELLIEPEFAADCQRRLSPALLDSQPAERLEVAPQSLLAGCGDGRIRADLERSLTSGRLTARGLRKLLDEYGLTWRESQVFVRYYLPDGGSGASSRQRRDLAAQLGIAEHTVRHHVNSIRGKLGLGAQRGMAAYRWAVSQDIISA